MACECDLCVRNRKTDENLAKIEDPEVRAFWENIYDALNDAEMSRDVAEAIIEGSWPSADEIIKERRDHVAAILVHEGQTSANKDAGSLAN